MERKIQKNRVTLFCSNVEDGNMSQRFGDILTVKKNKKNFFESINIDFDNCYRLNIKCKDVIKHLDENNPRKTIAADAVIIDKPNMYAYLAFADCIPFVVYDDNVLAFAHLGWQSICEDLHIKVVAELINNYSCDINNLKVFFGPCIHADSYTFPNPAQLNIKGWKKFVKPIGKEYSVDLMGYIVYHIKLLGIHEENIIESDVDTAQNSLYYSHYRSMHEDVEEGRFIFGAGITL